MESVALTMTPEKKFENFYGRRRGKKMRPARSKLVEELLPQLTIVIPAQAGIHGEAVDTLTWIPAFAGMTAKDFREVWLEVGFGAGEHLVWQAERNPDVLLIGAEPYINGVAKLLSEIEEKQLKNIRILPNDVRPLLDALPDQSLSRVFVLFPDPWPKKRHWERRFIGPDNLDRLARLLKPEAELRLATDDKSLLPWMTAHTRKHPAFRWNIAKCHDWLQRPDDWPATRYELKAIKGRPYFLRFSRR